MDTSVRSIKKFARIGGVFYLMIIIAGIFGELFVRGKMVVHDDPFATATNIMASPFLWRIGIAGDLLQHIFDLPVMLLFYVLLKPVNKNLALLALLFTMVQTAVLVATKLNLFTPLFLTENSNYLKAFDSHQLQVLSYISIRADANGFGIGLLFFGFVLITNGYLVRRSDYMPKLLGLLMQIAGICYLVNSFALILDPRIANRLFPFILFPAFITELSLCFWLIGKGVYSEEWENKVNPS
jgi:hypothetical protein